MNNINPERSTQPTVSGTLDSGLESYTATTAQQARARVIRQSRPLTEQELLDALAKVVERESLTSDTQPNRETREE